VPVNAHTPPSDAQKVQSVGGGVVLLIALLAVRPTGLFGERERTV